MIPTDQIARVLPLDAECVHFLRCAIHESLDHLGGLLFGHVLMWWGAPDSVDRIRLK